MLANEFLAILAIATSVTASSSGSGLFFTQQPTNVQVGKPVVVHYSALGNADQPVQILLRKGTQDRLTTIATLTTSATGGLYTWTPSADLEIGFDYALEIKLDDEFNYTAEFGITGGKAAGKAGHEAAVTTATPSVTTAPVSTDQYSATGVSGLSSLLSSLASSMSANSAMSSTPSGLPTHMPIPLVTTSPAVTASYTANATTMATSAGVGTNAAMPSTSGGMSTAGLDAANPNGVSKRDSHVALLFGAFAAVVYLH